MAQNLLISLRALTDEKRASTCSFDTKSRRRSASGRSLRQQLIVSLLGGNTGRVKLPDDAVLAGVIHRSKKHTTVRTRRDSCPYFCYSNGFTTPGYAALSLLPLFVLLYRLLLLVGTAFAY